MTQPRLFGGRYELGELIGYGGMAEVHRGRDARLGRDVAIKVLRADLARDPSFLARFRREAQAAAGLNHPSIVAVYDTGEQVAPDGVAQPYIVMEYVEGRTLRDILKAEGRLPARRAMEIAADVCNALDFSHRNGLIHRDIKPANVMITDAGAVKVMDFGIARAVADNAATVTQTANVIGTAQYLSPEQARGESVDARSDVYSCGCLLYELVTGVPPFQGDSPVAVAYQHVRESAPVPSSRVPDLPRTLDSIVMKALAKNQLNRYQSAAEMRTDLQRALANQPVTAEAVMTDAERTQFIQRPSVPPVVLPPGGPVDYAADERRDRRRALLWVAIVVALLIVIGAAAFLILKVRGNGTNTPPAVAVPYVIGSPLDVARTKFDQRDIKLQPDPQGAITNGVCDNGQTPTTNNVVCKLQQNGATVTGQKVAAGSTVYYQLFQKKTVLMPPVVGEQYGDALSQLSSPYGLHVTQKQVNSKQPANTVVGQDPAPNTPVSKGSTVVLDVSTGQVKLPKVTGLKTPDAKRKLNETGFPNVDTSQTQPTDDPAKDGTVYSEDPTPGIAYPTSQKVTLVIYSYTPPTSTTPSCTPSTPGVPVTSTPPGQPPTCPSGSTSPSTSASPAADGAGPAGLGPADGAGPAGTRDAGAARPAGPGRGPAPGPGPSLHSAMPLSRMDRRF